MKRSKVFLGITCALLATAGIAAAKARKSGMMPLFYFTSTVSNCYFAGGGLYTAGGNPSFRGGYKPTPNGPSYLLYTDGPWVPNSRTGCEIPAYFNED